MEYVNVDDTPTHVIKTKPPDDNSFIKDSLVLIIPGKGTE